MGAVDTYPPANVTSGPVTLGYGAISSGPTISTAETDLPGATATVFVAPGRRIKITGRMFIQSPSTANNEAVLWLSEDGVHKAHCVKRVINVGDAMDFHVEFVSSPAPGTHTYKLSGQITVGTGNFVVSTGSDRVGFIVVEDITGQQLPVLPQSVPVGQLGYASINAIQGSITAANPGTPIVGLSVNVVVPAGRVLKVSAQGYHWNTTANTQGNLRILMDGSQIAEQADREVNANTAQVIRAETCVSPAAGAHTFSVNFSADSGGTATFGGSPAFILVEDITPTPAPATTSPSSTIGYAENVTNVGSITNTDVDLASITVTVAAGRRIRLTASSVMASSIGTDNIRLVIKEGGTVLTYNDLVTGGAGFRFHSEVIITPTAGTHTYKVSAVRASGTGTITSYGTSGPTYILAEDITGTSLAHNHDSSPSSTLGYAEATAAVNIGAGPTDLPSLSVTVTVPAGRRIRINTDLPHYWYSDGTTTYAIQIYKNGVLWATVGWTARVPVSESGSLSGYAVDSPSAGTHTYKVVAVRSSGAGTLTVHGSSVSVQRLLVEDITGTGITGHTHTEFDIPTYYLVGSSTPGSTGSGSFVNYPGVPTKTITKRRADTGINVAGHLSCYKTTNTGYVDFGLLLNGVDIWMTRFFFNNVGMHMDQGMFGAIGVGLPPGDYTIALRWRVGSADANVDGNDFFHISFREGMVV